jgi:AcrR family transcriptional regulator
MPARRRLSRAEQQAETRARLLDAAVAVCARKGLHAATVEEIADAAGYTRGAVYSNFKDREDLLQQVFERRVQARLEALADLVDAATPRAQERAVADLIASVVSEEREYLHMLSEFWGHAARRAKTRRWFAQVRRRERELIRDMIDRRVADGDLELRVPAEHLAAGLQSLSLGLVLEGLIDEELDVEGVHAAVFGLVYKGSVRNAAGGSQRS